jgi:hypothetical protein
MFFYIFLFHFLIMFFFDSCLCSFFACSDLSCSVIFF